MQKAEFHKDHRETMSGVCGSDRRGRVSPPFWKCRTCAGSADEQGWGIPPPPPQPAWDHAGSRLCPRAKGDSRSSAVLQTDSTKVLVFQAVCSLCARQYASRKKYSPSSVLYAPFVQIAKLLSASKNLSVTTVYSQVCISGHLWNFKVGCMYCFWKTGFCTLLKVDLFHQNKWFVLTGFWSDFPDYSGDNF